MSKDEWQEMKVALNEMESMIDETGEMFERLVKSQDHNISLYYPGKTEYVTLVRRKDGNGKCTGATWKKYYRSRSNNVWLTGWSISAVPVAAIKKRMDEEGVAEFDKIHKLAKEIHKVRNELVTKNKRIKGTLRSIESFREKQWARLKKVTEELPEVPPEVSSD